MEKYVDERALRHFRDKAVEVDIQPKINDLRGQLDSAKTDLKDRMDGYVEQLCRVETGGALLQTAARIPVRLSFDGLYSARFVVWLNGTTSSVSGDPLFSISASGTNAIDDFVKVSLGSGNEMASGSIALDIMPATQPIGKLHAFNVMASGCVRVGDDVTLVQGFRTISFTAGGSQKNLVISIAPTSTLGGSGRCGFSYSALYDAASLVPED